MGIPHIESLSPIDFISTVSNFSKFTITEKIDGSNLIFGFDNDGRFYTSREGKNGLRYYAIGQYPMHVSHNGNIAAHVVLDSIRLWLRAMMSSGDAIEIEVLFGRQPNTIVYGSNRIVFLRPVVGDNGRVIDQQKVTTLSQTLAKVNMIINSPIITSEDGVTFNRTTVKQTWKFSRPGIIDSYRFADVDLSKELKIFNDFLQQKNSVADLNLTNNDIININLNKVQKEHRPIVKKERERLSNLSLSEHKLPIKEKILDNTLRSLTSTLQDTKIQPHEDIGVEGAVLRNNDTLDQIKIVDKDMFTSINKFNYAIRDEIKSSSRKYQKMEYATIEFSPSIFTSMLRRNAEFLGYEGLGDTLSIKQTLRKLGNGDAELAIDTLIINLKSKNFEEVQKQIFYNIVEGLGDLHIGLTKFNKEWMFYTHTLKNGKLLKYTNEIQKRTLVFFAEIHQEMDEILNKVHKSKTLNEIICALYGKQLKSL